MRIQRLGKITAWLLISLLLVIALIISVARIALSYTEVYQTEILQQLSKALGKPVTAEWVRGNWNGLYPQIQARHVKIGKSQSLMLKQLSVDVRPLASLISGQLRVAKINLEGLQLALIENEHHEWRVLGLPEPSADEVEFSYPALMKQLAPIAEAELTNGRFAFFPYQADPVVFKQATVFYQANVLEQQITASLRLPDDTALTLQAAGQLDSQQIQQSQLKFSLHADVTDWARWLPVKSYQEWAVKQADFGFNLLGELSNGGVSKASFSVAADEITFIKPDQSVVNLKNPAVDLYFKQQANRSELWIEKLSLPVLTKTSKNSAEPYVVQGLIEFEQNTKGEIAQPEYTIQIPHIDLAQINQCVLNILPHHHSAYSILQSLNFQGELNNLQATWRPKEQKKADQLAFSAALKAVDYSAWGHVPSATGITGTIHGDLLNGELRLDTQEFSLHLREVFPQPWQYRRANAQLTWEFDEQGFKLTSPYLKVIGDEGNVAGDFVIRLFDDPQREDYMDLRVGLTDGSAAYTEKYLPTKVPSFDPALADWLKTAIVKGEIEQGYFQYQGAISRQAPAHATEISLYFDVKNAELAYQPEWPSLQQADALVVVDGRQVEVALAGGKILNTQITHGLAHVPLHTSKTQLLLEADLQSNMQDGLTILQATPIASGLAFLRDWKGEGRLPARLKLAVPLATKAPDLAVQVDFTANKANLDLTNLRLPIKHITGDFKFDLQQGLSAKKVKGELFGQTFEGVITAGGSSNQALTEFDLAGIMPVSSLLSWAEIKQATPVSGSLPYHLKLAIKGSEVELKVDSDLQGVAIDLPRPFYKVKNSSQPFSFELKMPSQASPVYRATYANLLSVAASVPNHSLDQLQGAIVIGRQPAAIPRQQGLQVTGQVSEFNLTEWEKVQDKYLSNQQLTQGISSSIQLSKINVSTPNFSGLGINNQPLRLSVMPSGAEDWQIDFQAAMAKGSVKYFANNRQPHQVRLENLKFLRPESSVNQDKPQDSLKGFNPRTLPNSDVVIDELSVGDQVLGKLRFKTRALTNGVRFIDIASNLQGLTIRGRLDWLLSGNQVHSDFTGQLQGKDIGKVLAGFGFAKTITSKQFFTAVNGRWEGSPAAIGGKSFTGDMDVRFSNGQLVKIEGNAQAVRVFGLLNFDTIGRRLRLDFSDIFDKGLAYDTIKARFRADRGVFRTVTPLVLDGPSTDFQLTGIINIPQDFIDARLEVTLPLVSNFTIAAIAAGAPVVGGAIYFADKALGNRLEKMTSVSYRIRGPWKSPEVTRH